MYALYTYRPSYAVMFLIIVGMAFTRYPAWMAMSVVLGYVVFDFLDYTAKRKAIEKLFEEETTGWERDEENSEFENQGNLSRIKLTGQNQIIVTRIWEILRRMPR